VLGRESGKEEGEGGWGGSALEGVESDVCKVFVPIVRIVSKYLSELMYN
jgi:hypothetical protein